MWWDIFKMTAGERRWVERQNDVTHSEDKIAASYTTRPFSHVALQCDILKTTICATMNWHNCQLLLSKEFLLLFQWKAPAAWELCSVHKPQGPNTLLICLLGESKFTFPRKTTAILWDHPPPHTHTHTFTHSHTHCHRCRAPPKSHFLLYVALIGGVLVNQSCQNINGSLRITFHASKTEPRVL